MLDLPSLEKETEAIQVLPWWRHGELDCALSLSAGFGDAAARDQLDAEEVDGGPTFGRN